MKKIYIVIPLMLIISTILIPACGRIEQNHVGVRTTFTGKVSIDEMSQGFYTAITSSVDEYTAKEITVELFDMKPKAADNLTMADLDIEVYYQVKPGKVADLKIKYTGRDAWQEKLGLPAFFLVRSISRNAVYEEIAKYTSLDIHTKREVIAAAVKNQVQKTLDQDDPDAFTITKVIFRSAVTDRSIEESIKLAVSRKKELEAKKIELKIARQQVEINKALNKSLTPAVLRQRELDVQTLAIEKGGSVHLIMGNGITPLVNLAK